MLAQHNSKKPMSDYNPYSGGYSPILDLEVDVDSDYENSHSAFNTWHGLKGYIYSLVDPVSLILLAIGFVCGVFFDHRELQSTPDYEGCQDVAIRLEWRSLSKTEKREYIEAVQCLRNKTSRLGLNQSLYDDFPYVHINSGESCTSLSPLILYRY